MFAKGLNNTILKIIAISIMLIDHIAVVNLEVDHNLYLPMRLIGRLAFPVFAFLIVEGYYKTRNFNNYLKRLIIFALASEIPFDLAFYNTIFSFEHQNVFFTLAIGLMMMRFYERDKNQGFIYVVIFSLLAMFLRTDYSFFGILMIFCFYYFRNKHLLLSISIFFVNLLVIVDYLIIVIINQERLNLMGIAQIFSVFSLILIFIYNYKKGPPLKYLFYLFYPLHLILLYILSILY